MTTIGFYSGGYCPPNTPSIPYPPTNLDCVIHQIMNIVLLTGIVIIPSAIITGLIELYNMFTIKKKHFI